MQVGLKVLCARAIMPTGIILSPNFIAPFEWSGKV